MGERSQLLLLYVVALAPGIALTAAGVFGHWDAAAETVRGGTVASTSATAQQIWQSTEALEPMPITAGAPKPQASATAKSRGSSCTDLRALFGLGEKLTEAQKLYLQQHC